MIGKEEMTRWSSYHPIPHEPNQPIHKARHQNTIAWRTSAGQKFLSTMCPWHAICIMSGDICVTPISHQQKTNKQTNKQTHKQTNKQTNHAQQRTWGWAYLSHVTITLGGHWFTHASKLLVVLQRTLTHQQLTITVIDQQEKKRVVPARVWRSNWRGGRMKLSMPCGRRTLCPQFGPAGLANCWARLCLAPVLQPTSNTFRSLRKSQRQKTKKREKERGKEKEKEKESE